MDNKIFFTGGIVKSGTTLVQKMLDIHPDICCKKEQDLNILLKLFITEGESLKPFVDDFNLKNYFPLMIEKILANNCNKKLMGLKDNKFLLDNIYEVFQIFEGVKIIFIVRNPIDNLLSWWDHHLRLTDLGMIDQNIDQHDFLISNAKMWSKINEKIISSSQHYPSDILIVRYEDILAHKVEILEKICSFLDVNLNKNIIDDIIKRTAFSKMKSDSKDPSFYKKARSDYGKSSNLDNKIKFKIEAITLKERENLNYL